MLTSVNNSVNISLSSDHRWEASGREMTIWFWICIPSQHNEPVDMLLPFSFFFPSPPRYSPFLNDKAHIEDIYAWLVPNSFILLFLWAWSSWVESVCNSLITQPISHLNPFLYAHSFNATSADIILPSNSSSVSCFGTFLLEENAWSIHVHLGLAMPLSFSEYTDAEIYLSFHWSAF